MNAKTYQLIMRILAIIIAMVVAWSIIAEVSVLIPLATIVAAILLAMVFRRMTKEVMVDERINRIEEKSAALTYRLFTVVSGMAALGLILFRQSLPAEWTTVGETLAYTVCGLMLTHMGSHYYFKRRL
jgi:uncharacterized membrane protein